MLTLELYNQLRGTHFAVTDHNMALINKLNSLGVTEDEVKSYQMPAGSKQHELRQMASDMAKTHGAPRKPAATPADPEPIKEVPMATGNKNADALIAALNSILTTPQIDEAQIDALVDKKVDAKLQQVRPTTITVKTPEGTHEIKGITHESFNDILTYVYNHQAVYMYGPAGTGKTFMASQIADAIGIPFYYSGQLSQEYKFSGFTDAMGHFQPTPFYKAWTEGGLFFLDELEKSFPDVVTCLNGALANGIYDFPAPIGVKKMHPDFRCLAAGNTFGRGATGIYTAANQLDASTLNRFCFVEVNYDKRIEDAIDPVAAEFVRALRKASDRAGFDLVLSYRQITSLAKFNKLLGVAKAIKQSITAPLTRDDINILKNSSEVRALVDKGNMYAKALA